MSDAPAPPPPPPEPSRERERVLRRSKSDRMIAGVCGGLGRYLGIDPVLLRIAFVVLALAGGGGFLAYIAAWILIPEEGPGEELGEARPSSGETLRLAAGGVLIVLGVLWLVDVSFPSLGRFLWPLALIAIGVGLIVRSSTGRR